MGVKTMIQVDKAKFSAALKKRGLTPKEVSLELGYEQNFIHNSVSSRGRINKPAAMALKKLYNIDESEYELVEYSPEESEEMPLEFKHNRELKIGFDYDKLYEVIFKAVSDALNA